MVVSNLADQLSQLVNSAPEAELDPEAAEFTEGDFPAASHDELAELIADEDVCRAVTADIALDGGQYSGRRSSRAAVFGRQDASSSDTEGSGSEGDLVPTAAIHLRESPPFIDYATVPTMFVNGHMHGPGRDDPTSSSSTFEESDEDEERADEQQHHTVDAAEQEQQQREDLPQPQTNSSIQDDAGDLGLSADRQLQEGLGLGVHDQQHPMIDQAGSRGGTTEEHVAANSTAGDMGHGHSASHVTDLTAGDVAAAAATATAMLGDDAEMQELEREAAAAQAEAAEQLVAAATHSSKDAAKAAGVRAQQRLWGAALELRIRLQKAVAGANVLPRPVAAAVFKTSNQQVTTGYSALLSSCQTTLEELLQLHSMLARQHPAAAASLAAAEQAGHGHKTKLSRDAAGSTAAALPAAKYAGRCSSAAAAWGAVDEAIDSLAGFRDAALDKWHRRTVLSSGTAALRGSSGLRALQQSVSKQVAALLADKQMLLSRSQLPRQLAPRPLGQAAGPAASGSAAEADDVADDEAPAAAASGRDPETYDEGDFYQQLLKELIESAPGGLAGQLAAARPAKRRKLVDRRASKGRKLRYHTLDKLVGFMAPSDLVTPPFAEQLFANLFIHHT